MEKQIKFIMGEFPKSDASEDSERVMNVIFYQCSLMVERYIKAHVKNQDDVCNLRQEVMLKVLEGLEDSYHERGHFIQWVMTIAVNVVNDYYRKSSNKPIFVSCDEGRIVQSCSDTQNMEPLFKVEHLYQLVSTIYEDLSPREQFLLYSVFHLNMSFREIAECHGMSKSGCYKFYRSIILKIQKRTKNIKKRSSDDKKNKK